MGLTEKQEALVKESWDWFQPAFLFSIAPAAKNMFSFLRDSPDIPQNNPKLKAHALKVFKMTCESAIELREKGEVVVADATLKHLGAVHVRSGVIEPHFQVVKEALLRTVEEAVGKQRWSEEMKAAWGDAYDHLASAIKAHMNNNTHHE